jgi:hypothetical protein
MGDYKDKFGRINGKVLLKLTEERVDKLISGDYADVIIITEAINDIKTAASSAVRTMTCKLTSSSCC